MLTTATEDGCPWSVETPASNPCPPLEGPTHVDVAVVGGGLAGLSAAYHLRQRRPDARIAVLEASVVGAGASGRGTGMVGPGVGGDVLTLRRRHGDATARAMFHASAEAVEAVLDLVDRERLACELDVTGQLVVAQTGRQAARLQHQAKTLAGWGFDVPYSDRRALAGVLPEAGYAGALHHRRAATLNPWRLCQGLKERLLALGVAIFEHSPVEALRPGSPVRLACPEASVTAEEAVIATDGYTGRLGLLRDQVVPLDAHVIRTAPLPAAALAGLGWPGREAVIESRTFFNYYRLTVDRRIVFGGGRVAYRTGRPDKDADFSDRTWRRLEAELRALFPRLAAVDVTDRWSGTTGSALDRLPMVARLDGSDGVWFSGAWCGHGVALSVASGRLLATLMTGGSAAGNDLPWVRGRAPRLPGEPWRGWGLRAYLAALDAADRMGLRRERVVSRLRPRTEGGQGMSHAPALGSTREVALPPGTLRYREIGQGPPLVFLHGFLVNGDLWRGVVPQLADRYRCLVPDLPLGGHELPMDPEADLSLPGLARLVDGFLAALGLDGVALVTNDMGGAIAQVMAVQHPLRIARMVITNGDAFEHFPPRVFAYLKTTGHLPGGMWLASQLLRLRAVQRLPTSFGWLTRRPIPPEVMRSYLTPGRTLRGVRRDTASVLRSIDRRHTLTAAEALRDFRRPTLLAWANTTRAFPLSDAYRLAARMLDARVVVIEDSGALIPEDRPGELAAVIGRFLADTDRPPSTRAAARPGSR